MNVVNSIYYPEKPWLNPFDDNKSFDLYLSLYSSPNIDDNILLKEKLYIQYNRIQDVVNFFNNLEYDLLKTKIQKKLVNVVFIGNDSFPMEISTSDYNKMSWIFKSENIQFWQTNYYNENLNATQKIYIGTFIHYLLKYILSYDYNHIENSAKKYFLTFNNKEKPNRVKLFKLYENLNEIDKEKIIASFNFKSKFLDTNLFQNNGKNEIHELYYTLDILNFYKDVMFEIVCETGIVNVTEKSYKPLILGVPFILYNMDSSNHLKYFENIGIDVNYFNIDYSDIKNVDKFILEILSDDISTIKEKWSNAFSKAKENRIKIYEYFSKIKTEIKSL
jgi:hypothetical protein